MNHGPTTAPVGVGPADPFLSANRRIPAWLMSAALHFLLFVTLALLVRVAPRGAAVEPDREGGIVLVHANRGKTEYFAEEAAEAPASASPSDASSDVSSLPEKADQTSAAELMRGLPSLPSPGQALGGGAAVLPDISGFTAGTGSRPALAGEVKTSVFGVSGSGSKFLYVFDRSGSMQGYQGRPLEAAKRELTTSLKSLSSVQQFQIVFYNERTTVFNPYFPERPRLLFGDEPTLRQAERFVQGVEADGGTRHMEAIRLALAMAPDVVFFLTDAAEPQLTAAELAEIRRLNRGEAVINAIEFGTGAFPGGRNFLVRLADQNRGQHVYVDVTKLPAPAR